VSATKIKIDTASPTDHSGLAVLKDLQPVTSTTEPSATVIVSLPADAESPKLVAKKKVAIVGFAPSTIDQAPWDNPEWTVENGCEIWGINELYLVQQYLKAKNKATRWMDIHDRRDGDISLRDPNNVQWMKDSPIPLYMQEHYDDIPNSVAYPREEMIRHYRTNYFTNSISYQLAVAGTEGRDEDGKVIDPDKAFGEVHVYGVDMSQDSEYGYQRPSCEYFIGFLRGRGIKVYIPPQSDLLKTPYMYGFEGDGQAFRMKLRARKGELDGRSAQLKNNAQALLINAAQLDGAQKCLANIIEQVGGALPTEIVEQMKQQMSEMSANENAARQQWQQALIAAASLDGAADNVSWVDRCWSGS
jgi:hypothetical protein